MAEQAKNCLRWSMGYKEVRRLCLTARTPKGIPGKKRCSWVTYRMKVVSRFWTCWRNIDRCGVADLDKSNQQITE